MKLSGCRVSLALVALIALVGTGCEKRRRAVRMANLAAPLLTALRSTPSKLPPEPPPGAGLLTTLASIRADGRFHFEGSVHELTGGSLRYDRARASRLTTPTEYWVLVFDEQVDQLLYWIPVSDPRRIRVEPGGVVTRRAGSVALRLPFHPSGWVAVFETAGTAAAPLDELQFPVILDPGTHP